MSTSDIDLAFQALNIEPLYGHLSHVPTSFRRVVPNQQQINQTLGSLNASGGAGTKANQAIYFVEDEEVDFDKVLRDERVVLPKMVNWHAHWLAVEGIQPLTADNPPKPPLSGASYVLAHVWLRSINPNNPITVEQKNRKQSPPRSVLAPVAPALQNATNRKYKPVKHVLSRELQIYYSRLTAALLPSNTSNSTNQSAADESASAKRTAALSSLQHDAGLQNLLPYLVRWVGQSVVTAIRNVDSKSGKNDGGETIGVLLKVIYALIQNERLFIEPYVSPLTPFLFSADWLVIASSNPPPSIVNPTYFIIAFKPTNPQKRCIGDLSLPFPPAWDDLSLTIRATHQNPPPRPPGAI